MIADKSYAYFALMGDDFDPSEITKVLGIEPTDSWSKGDTGKHIQRLKYTCWELRSSRDESLNMNSLIKDVIDQLKGKECQINQLKVKFGLTSVIRLVMYIDTHEESSTPFLGHEMEEISFLYETETSTDVDIYRYNSAGNT